MRLEFLSLISLFTLFAAINRSVIQIHELNKRDKMGGAMSENKRRIRVDCDDRCQLLLNDSSCLATVKNISFGGALIHFYNQLPDLHVGDNCKVRMNGEPSNEYSCEVVRVENYNIAVIFNDMERSYTARHTR